MVMPNKVAEVKVAAGAGTEEGRRPTVVPAPAAATPELSDRPRRRTFTAQEKLRILAETDRAAGYGRDRRHPAPGRSVLVDPDRMAPTARRRRLRGADAGQARTEGGRRPTPWRRNWRRPTGRMRGSSDGWSTPRRSSTSKKKLRPCWGFRWRRQTATTSHDGCGRRPGARRRPDRRRLRCPGRVARQRLSPARRIWPGRRRRVAPDRARPAR